MSPVAVAYVRRQPELTAQHRLVRKHWPQFEEFAKAANDGRGLPPFVGKAVKAYLRCGQLGHGFVRVRCDGCGQDQLVAFSCKQRGICPSCDGNARSGRNDLSTSFGSWARPSGTGCYLRSRPLAPTEPRFSAGRWFARVQGRMLRPKTGSRPIRVTPPRAPEPGVVLYDEGHGAGD